MLTRYAFTQEMPSKANVKRFKFFRKWQNVFFFFSDYEKAIELFEKTQEKVGAIILKKETLVELLSLLLELTTNK